ncbi:MAG: poly[(R)-3-hydroxyalkanoate] polymerase subunit PhaC [Candidatus Binatota bacterium]|jgi:polyhydroxyalkanoate synthase|nr:poly[(R)-3-hydroxyalkanoate] polymerase subunit PhaC [Candidatus Binatota bacterium]
MIELITDFTRAWTDGLVRTLEGFRRGLADPCILDDPEPVTPYQVIYEEGRVQLRHYPAPDRRQATPLFLVYALFKRPWLLDMLPGRSVVESLNRQGFDVYLTDWLPPRSSDRWRGFDAYVNGDLADAVRAVQIAEDVEQVSVLGYCSGGILAAIYAALHPENVKNLVTLTLPFDMSARDRPTYAMMQHLEPETIDLVTANYGNCPAWMVKAGFDAMAPLHNAIDKYVGLYRNRHLDGYAETFALIERWMASDVPLAGKLFRELAIDVFRENRLARNELAVGGRVVDVREIRCPLLNVIGEFDEVVPPSSSLPFADAVGSEDKRTLTFRTGHIGPAASASAIRKLWPAIGGWLAERDS